MKIKVKVKYFPVKVLEKSIYLRLLVCPVNFEPLKIWDCVWKWLQILNSSRKMFLLFCTSVTCRFKTHCARVQCPKTYKPNCRNIINLIMAPYINNSDVSCMVIRSLVGFSCSQTSKETPKNWKRLVDMRTSILVHHNRQLRDQPPPAWYIDPGVEANLSALYYQIYRFINQCQ